MTNEESAGRARTPKHLWVVAILALLWNSMGAFDFTMTQTNPDAYLKAYTPQQVEFVKSIPAGIVAAWGIGTLGGFLGSLLLLLRKRLAVPVYLASLVGALVSQVWTYGISDGLAIMGGGAGALAFAGVILTVAGLLFLYARAMARRGVLT